MKPFRHLVWSLFFILTGIHAQAQDLNVQTLRQGAWLLSNPEATPTANHYVMHFTDSFCVRTLYLEKQGTHIEIIRSMYYLSQQAEQAFDATCVGRNTQGKYLIRKNMNSGKVTCEAVVMENDSTLGIIGSNFVVERFTHLSPQRYEALTQQAATALPDAAHFDKLMQELQEIRDHSFRLINYVPNALPQVFDTFMKEHAGMALGDIMGLEISGPLAGNDILFLRQLVTGDSLLLPQLVYLNLNRAWVMTDTVSYHFTQLHWNHQRFMAVKGRRFTIRPDSSWALPSTPTGTISAVRNPYGLFVEIAGIESPEDPEAGDTLWLGFPTPLEYTVPDGMLDDMPHVQMLVLPASTEKIRWHAVAHCPQLKTIAIPPMVTHVSTGAFALDRSLRSVRISEGSALRRTPQFDLTNEKKTAFYRCHPALTITTEHARYPQGPYSYRDSLTNDTLRRAFNEVRDIDRQLDLIQRKLRLFADTDSIRSIKAEQDRLTAALLDRIINNALDRRNAKTAPYLLSYYQHYIDMDTKRSLYHTVDEETLMHPMFQTIRDDVERDAYRMLGHIDYIDYFDPADIRHVVSPQAGMLRRQLADEEWRRLYGIKVSGPIDDADIAWLRSLSCRETGDTTARHLQVLDLGDATLGRLPEAAFWGCFTLQHVTLPKTMQAIGKRAFARCSVARVVMPDSLKVIEADAFYRSRIGRADLPEGLRKIQSEAFGSCEYLTDVTLPESLDTLGTHVFANSRLIGHLRIPAKTSWIGMGLANRCIDTRIEVDPGNQHYRVVEGQLAGITPQGRRSLGQVEKPSPQRYLTSPVSPARQRKRGQAAARKTPL